MRDRDQGVEVERQHDAKREDPAPGAGELEDVESEDRRREDRQRDHPDVVGFDEAGRGEAETGRTGEHAGHQEDRHPGAIDVRAEQVLHDHEAGDQHHQAQQDVEPREKRESEDCHGGPSKTFVIA